MEIPILTQGSVFRTLSYLVLLVFLHKVLPYVTSYKLTIFLLTLMLQTVPAFLFILDVNPLGLLAFFNNKAPVWARPYTKRTNHETQFFNVGGVGKGQNVEN